jgi:hypothetical protein
MDQYAILDISIYSVGTITILRELIEPEPYCEVERALFAFRDRRCCGILNQYLKR